MPEMWIPGPSLGTIFPIFATPMTVLYLVWFLSLSYGLPPSSDMLLVVQFAIAPTHAIMIKHIGLSFCKPRTIKQFIKFKRLVMLRYNNKQHIVFSLVFYAIRENSSITQIFTPLSHHQNCHYPSAFNLYHSQLLGLYVLEPYKVILGLTRRTQGDFIVLYQCDTKPLISLPNTPLIHIILILNTPVLKCCK